MQGKDNWWCDGCDKEFPQTAAYWLVVSVAEGDKDRFIESVGGQHFRDGDFCKECMKKMVSGVELIQW